MRVFSFGAFGCVDIGLRVPAVCCQSFCVVAGGSELYVVLCFVLSRRGPHRSGGELKKRNRFFVAVIPMNQSSARLQGHDAPRLAWLIHVSEQRRHHDEGTGIFLLRWPNRSVPIYKHRLG